MKGGSSSRRAYVVLGLAAVVTGMALMSPVTAEITKLKVRKIATKVVRNVIDTAATSFAGEPGFSTTSATPVDVPGASLRMNNGTGADALLFVTLSSSTACHGSGPGSECIVRALLDGSITLQPEYGTAGYIFDSRAADGLESHAVTFHSTVGPGAHIVQLQAFTSEGGGVTFDLRAGSLVAQVAPLGGRSIQPPQ